MYPKDASQLAALFAAVTPLLIWAASGAFSVYTRLGENRREDWRRINDLISILYRSGEHGHWAQMLSVTELSSFKRQSRDLKPIMVQASNFFAGCGNPTAESLAVHIDRAFKLTKVEKISLT